MDNVCTLRVLWFFPTLVHLEWEYERGMEWWDHMHEQLKIGSVIKAFVHRLGWNFRAERKYYKLLF